MGSRGRGGATPVRLALAGAAVSAFLGALTSAILVSDSATFAYAWNDDSPFRCSSSAASPADAAASLIAGTMDASPVPAESWESSASNRPVAA